MRVTTLEQLRRHYPANYITVQTLLADHLPHITTVAHLRRLYGRSVMSDVLQNAVNEANQKIVADNTLKLAFEPQIRFPENKEEIEAAMEAKGDLAFTVALEVLPKIELADLSEDLALLGQVEGLQARAHEHVFGVQ